MGIPLVKKASGEAEPFQQAKLIGSLQRAGASDEVIDKIVSEVEKWLYDGVSTKKIYVKAFDLLRKRKISVAARYSLKKAIMDLGPTGYPFEHFIGQVFKHQGFDVQVGQIIQGHCVQHEVDVIATSDKKQHFIECKYYNSQGKFASVQVPLYVRSRVDDIMRLRGVLPQFNGYSFHGWVVTNTRFTSDAMEFGKCSGLNLMSWDYPNGHGLKDIVEKDLLFPITVLTQLKGKEKQVLLENGVVLCQQILQNETLLDLLELKKPSHKSILIEVEGLCNT